MNKDFYGNEIVELIYKDGTKAVSGDVIRWKTWDSDDFTTWTFTGIYHSSYITYLGGCIDFGMDIGKSLEIEEVLSDSENNDPYDVGIVKIGVASDLARLISGFGDKL